MSIILLLLTRTEATDLSQRLGPIRHILFSGTIQVIVSQLPSHPHRELDNIDAI